MIILDASVLIAYLDASDAHHKEAKEILASTGSQALGASVITLAEVLVTPARQGRLEDAQAAIARLEVEEIAPTSGAAQRLASLRAATGLKMPDCCVLDAAGQAKGRVVTFGRPLAKAAEQLGLA